LRAGAAHCCAHRPAEAVRAGWRALHFVGAADCEAQMRAGGWI